MFYKKSETTFKMFYHFQVLYAYFKKVQLTVVMLFEYMSVSYPFPLYSLILKCSLTTSCSSYFILFLAQI